MNSIDESVDNTVSNLPLLFANGYPTSLDRISESQIQNFIPFMVQCSLGNINVPGKDEYSEPEWWPEDIEFIIPLTKPKKFQGNWLQKMKDIVRICYQFHKSVFLLRFCSDLASYELKRLRFINNFNLTTSLYDRRNNKLLVTFRNENMTYDQPQKNRKCLLQQKSRSQNTQQQIMVEPPLFDIYLCDNCDAELYSLEANIEHEKTCVPVRDDSEDDDVILISDNELLDDTQSKSKSCSTSQKIVSRRDSEFKNDFLKNFGLQDRESINNNSNNKVVQNQEPNNMTRRNRRMYQLSRCVTIPITSPAGQLLTGRAKVTDEYIQERLERVERFCSDKSVVIENRPGPSSRSKLSKRRSSTHVLCTFKKPQDYPVHFYKFPTRTYFSNTRYSAVQFLNKLLYDNYNRPLSVRLHKITESEINQKRHPNSDLKMKIIRQQGQCNFWEITNKVQKPEFVVDTIDLCSSDDEDDTNDNSNVSSAVSEESQFVKTALVTKRLNADSDRSVKNKYSAKRRRLEIDNSNSEITLTPIEKSRAKQNNIETQLPTIQPPQLNNDNGLSISSNNNNSNSNDNNNDSNFILNDENDKNQKYEGNFLISPHQEIVPKNLLPNISKPLQQSVFLISNYTTTNSTLLSLQQHSNDQQENLLDNIIQQTNDRTLPLITNVTSAPLNNNLSRNTDTTKVLQNLNFTKHYVDSDVTLSKINSPKPKRTISIDLT